MGITDIYNEWREGKRTLNPFKTKVYDEWQRGERTLNPLKTKAYADMVRAKNEIMQPCRDWNVELNFAVFASKALGGGLVRAGGSQVSFVKKDVNRYFHWAMPVWGVGYNAWNHIVGGKYPGLKVPGSFVYNPHKKYNIRTRRAHSFPGFLTSVQFTLISWIATVGISIRQLEQMLRSINVANKHITAAVNRFKGLTGKRGIGATWLYCQDGMDQYTLENPSWINFVNDDGFSTPVIGARVLGASPSIGANGYKLIIEQIIKQF